MVRIRVNTASAVLPYYCHGPHCRKKSTIILRHHMGNDRFLSNYNQTIWKQYYEYKDCIRLCDDCHMEIHWLYEIHITQPALLTVISPEVANKLRGRYIAYCNEWLSNKIKRPRIDRDFRKMWRRRIAEWQKSLSR